MSSGNRWLNKVQNAVSAISVKVSDKVTAATDFLIADEEPAADHDRPEPPPWESQGLVRRTSWFDFYNRRSQEKLKAFKGHYQAVVEMIGDLSLKGDEDAEQGAALLAESAVRTNLAMMLKLLREEDRQSSGVDRGVEYTDAVRHEVTRVTYPCLEFFLEERVMKLLCELGIADRPVGTMALILNAVSSLLNQISHPVLPSQYVHYPISMLVTAATHYPCHIKGAATPAWHIQASQMVHFGLAGVLRSIWRKIREDGAQLDFFLFVDKDDGSSQLDIFSSLTPLLQAHGAGTRRVARDACLTAISCKDKRAGLYIAHQTSVLQDQAEILRRCLLELTDPDVTEDSWALSLVPLMEQLRFMCAIAVAAFESMTTRRGVEGGYDDALLSALGGAKMETDKELEGLGSVGALLVLTFRHICLAPVLALDLLSASETTARQAQAVTAEMVAEAGKHDCGGAISPLLQELLRFLTSDDPHMKVRTPLRHRLNSASRELRISSMALFQAMLDLGNDPLLADLVLNCTEREGTPRFIELKQRVACVAVTEPVIGSFCQAFPGSPIHPDFLKFSMQPSLSRYMSEAKQRQIKRLSSRRTSASATALISQLRPAEESAQKDAVTLEWDSDLCTIAKEFGPELAALDAEGSLLHDLLNGLERVFERDVSENSALSGLFSSLLSQVTLPCLSFPRQLMVVMLLCPSGEEGAAHPVRSVLAVLQKLWKRGQARLADMPDSSQQLRAVRASMGVLTSEDGPQSPERVLEEIDESARVFLEGYVFLEELLKELFSMMSAKGSVEVDTVGVTNATEPELPAAAVSPRNSRDDSAPELNGSILSELDQCIQALGDLDSSLSTVPAQQPGHLEGVEDDEDIDGSGDHEEEESDSGR
ncbi:unnamed protein product [Chrysoparadoxa australica]